MPVWSLPDPAKTSLFAPGSRLIQNRPPLLWTVLMTLVLGVVTLLAWAYAVNAPTFRVMVNPGLMTPLILTYVSGLVDRLVRMGLVSGPVKSMLSPACPATSWPSFHT